MTYKPKILDQQLLDSIQYLGIAKQTIQARKGEATMPALGVVPRWLHDSKRMTDLALAIARTTAQGDVPLDEWLTELADLNRAAKKRCKG